MPLSFNLSIQVEFHPLLYRRRREPLHYPLQRHNRPQSPPLRRAIYPAEAQVAEDYKTTEDGM